MSSTADQNHVDPNPQASPPRPKARATNSSVCLPPFDHFGFRTNGVNGTASSSKFEFDPSDLHTARLRLVLPRGCPLRNAHSWWNDA